LTFIAVSVPAGRPAAFSREAMLVVADVPLKDDPGGWTMFVRNPTAVPWGGLKPG
jgi:hypothetical protein